MTDIIISLPEEITGSTSLKLKRNSEEGVTPN